MPTTITIGGDSLPLHSESGFLPKPMQSMWEDGYRNGKKDTIKFILNIIKNKRLVKGALHPLEQTGWNEALTYLIEEIEKLSSQKEDGPDCCDCGAPFDKPELCTHGRE